MAQPVVDQTRIRDHVVRLGNQHPPIDPDSVDRTVIDPQRVSDSFSHVLAYMARVEMEVERNVLELAMLLPGVGETDRLFYADVWQPQEIQHGVVLDQLQSDLGLPPATPDLTTVSSAVKVLGVLSHLSPVEDVIRMMYYLTGAATERSAILAYQAMHKGLKEMGEHAIADTVINPIKVQEPGHFAFYRMSATELMQSGAMTPWKVHLTRFLRSRTFKLVGANNRTQFHDYGGVAVHLGLDEDIEGYARDIGRVERQMLWASEKGLEVPPYVLASLRDAVAGYRERLRQA